MTPDRAKQIIEDAYGLRRSDDKDAVGALWAKDAIYELVRDDRFLRSLPIGEQPAATATGTMIDNFTFHDMTPLEWIVCGDRAAVRWRVDLSCKRTGRRATTEILDLWTFTADEQPKSLVQFCDTALVAELMR